MLASADSKNKSVANSSPARHQTLWQQGGSGEDGHFHLAERTLSAAAIEKKKEEEDPLWLTQHCNRIPNYNELTNQPLLYFFQAKGLPSAASAPIGSCSIGSIGVGLVVMETCRLFR